MHYIKIDLRGIGLKQKPIWFILTNPGKGEQLSLSMLVKRPLSLKKSE